MNRSALEPTNVTPAGNGGTGGNGGVGGAAGVDGGEGVGGEYGKLEDEIVGAFLAVMYVPVELSTFDVNNAAVLS